MTPPVACDEELWFRGVSHGSYELLPSLLRCIPAAKRTHERIRDLETNLFFEFLAKARASAQALDHWDTLFLMQHYRAPTRLLDWSEVLSVALHFSIAYGDLDKADCPRVYIMNPYRWNEQRTGTDTRPLEQIAPSLLRAIDIEASAVDEIQEQLDLSGINEFSLFPDLEGLARHLKRRYHIPKS